MCAESLSLSLSTLWGLMLERIFNGIESWLKKERRSIACDLRLSRANDRREAALTGAKQTEKRER